ncbi:hypothetical protein LVJ94_48870 [Pendulispora rubella]|uniref:Uncharacterized protein n=1 Tax=Pendulispora rubella TaxID=2741070 RepID=A0ABZ2LPI2_9BACT
MNLRDVKIGTVAAATSALLVVAVFQGKQTVSSAGHSPSLAPCDGVTFDVRGAYAAPMADEDTDANENLVEEVRRYEHRLTALEAERASLESKLATAENQLSTSDGGERAREVAELSQDDWKELAKKETIKYTMPCFREQADDWDPSPEQMVKLGLAPDDFKSIGLAYAHSQDRLGRAVRPLCQRALGGDPAVVAKIPLAECIDIVKDVASAADPRGVDESIRHVAEIRAGLRQTPPSEQQGATMKMFLALTGEASVFEAELAESFGPEEAHRLAHHDEMCRSSGYHRARRKPPVSAPSPRPRP